jgi:hypothetical protein
MAIRRIRLTDGNIRNGHIYLRTARDLFPEDAIGGSNRLNAGEPIVVRFEPGREVETDIAGDKWILRERAGVRDFLETTQSSGGDEIEVEAVGNRVFVIRQAS